MYKIGEFIKWSCEDAMGKFGHVGMITKSSEEEITFQVSSGSGTTMTVALDDGKLQKVDKPKNWGSIKLPAKEKATVTATTRAPKPGSKKQKSLDIYKGMMDGSNHPERKDVIATLVRELDMTSAGASTYAAVCKKSFG